MTLLRQSLMDREDQFEYKEQTLAWQRKQVEQKRITLEQCQKMLAFEEELLLWQEKKFELIEASLNWGNLSHEDCVELEKKLPPYPIKPLNR